MTRPVAERSVAPWVAPRAHRTVLRIARREFRTRVRTKSFLIGTVVVTVLLAGFVLLQTELFQPAAGSSTVGLAGQATALAGPLRSTTAALGEPVDVRTVTDTAQGIGDVRRGELEALVTGAPDALHVVVRDQVDSTLRVALTGIVEQQAFAAQLAEAGLDPRQVQQNVAGTGIAVDRLAPADPRHDERVVLGVITAFVLYFSLVFFGSAVAQGVVEEKASRVVEILLATVRPWQLLLGKVLGLGAVGLLQLLIVGVTGIALATGANVLPVPGLALGALAAGVLWYVLGYFLYAAVYAAAGSLVSRQEEIQAVLMPVSVITAAAFAVGANLLLHDDAGSPMATLLSLLPPFAPMLMPGRMAVGVAPAWQVGTAVALTLAAIALLTWLGGRVYARAVLRTGARVRLRDVLR